MDGDNYWVSKTILIVLISNTFSIDTIMTWVYFVNTLSFLSQLQLEIIAFRNQKNNSFASLDEFEYHVTDDCMLEPPAADPDSCGDDQFLCRKDKICIPIVSKHGYREYHFFQLTVPKLPGIYTLTSQLIVTNYFSL